jgi:hypothetical protein
MLHAPAAQCTLSKHVCKKKGNTVCTVEVANKGSVPCLYMHLELRDPAKASELQFHAASFSDNFFTLGAGEALTVTFRALAQSGPELQLCATGWNAERECMEAGWYL